MQVTVEVTGGLQRRMTVGVPTERVEQEMQTRLQSLARSTRVNGFRPGKVPVRVIRQRFGPQVRQEVIGEVLQESLNEAVTQEKLRPAAPPVVSSIQENENDEGFAYTVEFEIYPELNEVVTEGITVEKPVSQVVDGDIDEMIEDLRRQRQTWEEVERPAVEGDQVLVDYTGILDGQEFAGGSAAQKRLVLGGGQFLKDFETALHNAKAGNTVEFDLNFPVDYHTKEVAGKTAHFSVTVHKVLEARLPEVNEEFAAGFEIEEGGVEALRAEIRKNMERELEKEVRNKIKMQLFDELLEKNPIEVPSALVQNEAKQMAKNMTEQFSARGMKLEQELDPTAFAEQAEKRVKTGVLMMALIRLNKLKADSAKMRKMVEDYAEGYENPDEFVDWYYKDESRLADVEMAALEEQVVEMLAEKVEMVEKTMSFAEVIKKTSDAQQQGAAA